LKPFLESKIFLVGLLIKLSCLPFFGSIYSNNLFIPFVDSVVTDTFANPWSLFPPAHFPYGSILLVLLWFPKFIVYKLFGSFALGSGFMGLALFKLPLLGFDIFLLWTLKKIINNKSKLKRLLLYYWLNPIVFFVLYVHVQLDAASITFCLFSIYLITKNKNLESGLVMALATLCKFQVVIIVPFLVVFIWNSYFSKAALREIIKYLFSWFFVSILGFLPLIMEQRLSYVTTSSPQALRLFAAQIELSEGHSIYLGVLLLMGVLGRLCLSTRIYKRAVYFGSASIFGALLLGTRAAPGWYLWVMPFICLFFVEYLNVPRLLFWALNLLYILFFCVVEPFHSYLPDFVLGISFTFLQASLASILVFIWSLCLRFESPMDRRTKPLLIGISGDSGVGKNYLSHILEDLFHPFNTMILEGDDYHKWERDDKKWDNYTHLDPKANYLNTMAQDTKVLISGHSVLSTDYDHESGKFTNQKEIKPSKTLIVQGLHVFYLKSMRDALDLKVFIKPDANIIKAWKVKRDVNERGYSVDKVIKKMEERSQDSRRHIEPQKQFADWVIEYRLLKNLNEDDFVTGTEPEFSVIHTFWDDSVVGELIPELMKVSELQVKVAYSFGEIGRISLEVFGNISDIMVEKIALKVFSSLRQITRAWEPPHWRSGVDGISQLMALALLDRGKK